MAGKRAFTSKLSKFPKPSPGQAAFEAGNAAYQAGALADAAQCYARALGLDSGFAEAANNLGTVLLDLGQPAQAEQAYRLAQRIRPDYADPWYNLANIDLAAGRHAEAVDGFRRTLAARPDFALAEWNLALALLSSGQLAEGYAVYESRWRPGHAEPRPHVQPRWDGGDPSGKTILVWGEQGIGDEILHAGLIPDLAARGARVILECDPRLVGLFRRAFGAVTVAGRGDPLPPADLQIPLASLARFLRPDFAAFPARPAFLAADRDRAADLRARYRARGDGPVVGLSWHSKRSRYGAGKSVALDMLAPLWAARPAVFVDVQYGDTRSERAAFAKRYGRALHHDDEIDPLTDLDGFAAQLAACDLIISTSNSTVHMAGALGVPVWTLLPNGGEIPWCWFAGRPGWDGSSPWYPSMRLLRPGVPGDWPGVIAQAAAGLSTFGD